MYIVHVKRMTASDVRRDWFRVLDEVLAGETVVVERGGRRVVLRVADESGGGARQAPPDYRDLLRGNVDEADQWSWEWAGSEEDVEPAP